MTSPPARRRDERIDALRGFALLGILLVNIQSFLWGGSNPVGYLEQDASTADRVVFFVTAAFVNLKFMPLFALLFGAGFSLLLARLQETTPFPRAVFRRRMLFLFAFGVLHGVFFYYGDITHMYALAGMVLLLHADRSPAELRGPLILWWLGALALMLLLVWGARGNVPPPAVAAAEVADNFAVFTGAGYLGQLPTRIVLFADIVLANLIGLPLTVALMLTGMLAHRSRWLTQRAPGAWRWALALGFLPGLPAAVAYGAVLLAEAEAHGLGAYSVVAGIPGVLSVPLAFAYAALFLTRAPDGLVRLLAAPGRMPLTNYLAQSVAMGALLSGWGLALGERLGYTETALLALAIFAAQVLVSRWWLAHRRQGPLEALWRAWTYRGMPLREDVRSGS